MEIGKLKVQTRSATGKGIARQLRRDGFVPGICYGAGLEAPIQISIDPKALKGSLDPQKRRNTVIELSVEGDGGTVENTLTTMLWDYQIHPIKRFVTHVDLKSIDPSEQMEADVPIELTGKPKGVVNGGQINWARHQVTVRCKPADIPARYTLDITDLDVGDVLHVSDLPRPAGLEMLTPESLTIVLCAAPKVVVADEAAVEGEPVEGEAAAGEAGDAEAKGDKEGDS